MREISEALEAFSFELYYLKGEYVEKTLEVVSKNDITVYDVSYIALAIIKDTYMYTADEKLIERLKEEYLKYIRNIKDVR